MACFLVPAAEAVVATVAANTLKKKEIAQGEIRIEHAEPAPAVSLSAKLGWLCRLLWGGSVLLAFEHLWHGELIPWFPFLTAARNPADTAEMLREMGTVGVGMAVLITAVWAGMVVVSSLIERRALPDESGRETA